MEPSKDQCFSYWLCCLLVYTSWKRICRIYFILVLDNIIYKIVFPYTTLSKGHQLWETDPKAASFQLPVGMYIFSPKFNKAFISLTVQHSLFIDFYTKLNIFSSVSEWDMSFYLEKLNCPFITDFLLDISDPACLKAYVVVIVMVFYHFVSILRDRSTNQETENLDSNAFHEVADEEQIFTISVLTLWQAFNKIFRNLKSWEGGQLGFEGFGVFLSVSSNTTCICFKRECLDNSEQSCVLLPQWKLQKANCSLPVKRLINMCS